MLDCNITDFKAQLQELKAATFIVLMIVPPGVFFRKRVDQASLPRVSCVYAIQACRGSAFESVLAILTDSITGLDNEDTSKIDLRIGIKFKKNDKLLKDFYFALSGEQHTIGFSGNHRIFAKADLGAQIRAFQTDKDTVLIKHLNNRNDCPHS